MKNNPNLINGFSAESAVPSPKPNNTVFSPDNVATSHLLKKVINPSFSSASLYAGQGLSYNFSSLGASTEHANRKKANKIITNFYLRLSSLISTPFYAITPRTVIISLCFYFTEQNLKSYYAPTMPRHSTANLSALADTENQIRLQPINEQKGHHSLARLEDPDYSPILGAIPTEKSRFKPNKCCWITLLWVKLSNSGDTLKLTVPSYSGNAISGWSNHPGKVTSPEIHESEMGYRGSKSVWQISQAVKEQRVDGSYCINFCLIIMQLRYTLMDFERNYLFKVPSKQLNSSIFSTLNNGRPKLSFKIFSSGLIDGGSNFSILTHETPKLNPYFVTGLVDAESSFTISIYKDSSYKTGWRVAPFFETGLNVRDKDLLIQLKDFFKGAGTLRLDKASNTLKYSVANREDLTNIIIPHFVNYPLLSQKAADFLLFKQIVELMNQGAHKTLDGLQQIINIKASHNLGISDILKSEFTQTVPVERPIIQTTNIPDPQWISGFSSGEANFYCGIKESLNKKGHIVILRFSITQHARDNQLLELIIKYFDTGRLDQNQNTAVSNIVIERFSDLTGKIIPFFDKYPIFGIKNLDYLDWCKIAKLKTDGLQLTCEGLDQIRKIKSGMNRGRK